MNILILGGTGFLGKWCAKVLASNNCIYVVGKGKMFQSYNVTSYESGINNLDFLFHLSIEKKIDVVMHFVSILLPSSNADNFIF